MTGLTMRQKETLDFIVSYISKNKIAPTYREIVAALDLKSTGRVYVNVAALRERGYIDYSPKRSRSITVLFPSEGCPDWENVARALFLQNRILRDFVIARGWEADLPAMELP